MQYLESFVQRQVTMLLNGDMKYTSFLDRIGHISNVYEVRGSTYEQVGTRVKSYDSTEYITVERDANNRVAYNPHATDLLDLFAPSSADSSAVPPSVAQPRKFTLVF